MVDQSEMIFGVRAVIEAIQAGKEIDKILVKKDIQSDLSKDLFAVLKGTLIPVQRVPVERINRITRKNHQGVVAFISSVTYQKAEDLVPFLFEQGKNPLFVMLDGITDVRNFGAIARTCECAAADAVIIPAKNSVSVNADAMKTSAGALHTLPVCREQNLKDTLQFLKALFHGPKLRNGTKVLEKVVTLLFVLQHEDRLIQLVVFFLLADLDHIEFSFHITQPASGAGALALFYHFTQ